MNNAQIADWIHRTILALPAEDRLLDVHFFTDVREIECSDPTNPSHGRRIVVEYSLYFKTDRVVQVADSDKIRDGVQYENRLYRAMPFNDMPLRSSVVELVQYVRD